MFLKYYLPFELCCELCLPRLQSIDSHWISVIMARKKSFDKRPLGENFTYWASRPPLALPSIRDTRFQPPKKRARSQRVLLVLRLTLNLLKVSLATKVDNTIKMAGNSSKHVCHWYIRSIIDNHCIKTEKDTMDFNFPNYGLGTRKWASKPITTGNQFHFFAAAHPHPATLASVCVASRRTGQLKSTKPTGIKPSRERHFQVVEWTTKIVNGSSF